LLSDGAYRVYNPYGTVTRDEMIARCENSGQIWYYGSHEEFDISPPITRRTPKEFKDLIGTHENPQPFVCELNDIRLIGKRAIPQMKDGKFVLEEMGTETTLKLQVLEAFGSLGTQRKLQEIMMPFTTDFDSYDYDTVINLVPRHGRESTNYANFAHWLLEDLPRLRAYDHYASATGRRPKLLLKSEPQDWMKDTLNCLGFQSDNWIEWNRDTALVKNLVVPRLDYIHNTGSRFSPRGRNWVGTQIRRSCVSSNSEFSKNVFISRQKSKGRNIQNFDEVIDCLKEFGFESYCLEDLSIREQITLFSQAETVIGAHGAGLANTIYSEDIDLLEIFPYSAIATLYYILANEMDFEYGWITSEPSDAKSDRSWKNRDIIVDPAKLKKILDDLR
jgi:hypothetical protein